MKFTLILLWLISFSAQAQTAYERAALKWLALVDANKMQKSWESTDSRLQNSISRQDWLAAMQQIKSLTGHFKKRQLIAIENRRIAGSTTNIKILIYKSHYTKQQSVTETVISMPDSKGIWRISGYFVD